MTENKISVKQYIEDNTLLEISYVPYEVKAEIVEAIINKVARYGNNMKTINTALLHRVSCEIFIESITNIDMSVVSEEGLSGYDILCMNNILEDLLYEIDDEYARFWEILEFKISDFEKINNSTGAILFKLKDSFSLWLREKASEFNGIIENFDVKKLADNLKNMIQENLDKYNKDKEI